MATQTPRFRWARVLLAVLAVYLALTCLITVITTSYALLLGFEARGAPDHEKITTFAARLGATWIPRLGLLFTFLAGY